MTMHDIKLVVQMIDETMGTGMQVATVYEYINAMNNEQMYAVFTKACYNDILESPAVQNPVLIYDDGEWYGEYVYLNG